MDESQLIPLIMSLALAGFAGWEAWLRQDMKNWKRAPATILSAEVERRLERCHRGHSLHYSVKVVYEYEVNGKPVKSSRLSPFRVSASIPSMAEAKVKRFPVGSTVEAYVSPRNPYKSYLERPSPLLILFTFGVALFFGIAAVFYS
ncbi:MAG: DUF3592 domain-containing protein [Opitutales bacterium]|nr:DUF3592 domain-containing protein [Opitutales bacterium]